MADEKDENDISLEQKLNGAIKERISLLERQNEKIRNANSLTREFNELARERSASEKVENLKDALDKLSETQQENTKDLAGMFDMVYKKTRANSKQIGVFGGQVNGKLFTPMTKTLPMLGLFMFNFAKSIGDVISTMGSMTGAAFQVGKAIGNIGLSIAAIPFKIFNALVDEANATKGGFEITREFEKLREYAGDFNDDISKNVIKSFKSMRGELANTGLSNIRVFGIMHERMQFVRELATGMGNDFHLFGNEIANNAEVMFAYQKGLGLSAEQMQGFAAVTTSQNKTLKETLRTVTSYTKHLGKRFGVSHKLVSRDVGAMVKDLKNFGSVGIKEMAQLSIFTRQLGVDFKELQGVVNQFDTFEDAAENAAKLAQAFGMNVDAYEMMKEQDIGKRVDMLRKSFFETGRSVDQLTRQERNYLAQTAGIEASAIDQVFALKNASKTYDEVAKSGDKAKKQQMTTAESMKSLTNSIERLVKERHNTKGFFGTFVDGLADGIKWAGPFRKTIWNIKSSLLATEMAGRRLGRSFIKNFPGMKSLFGAFSDFFNPKKFRKMTGGIVRSFTAFFKQLSDPKEAKNALASLFSSLQGVFQNMFDSERGVVSSMIPALKKVFGSVGEILIQSGQIVLDKGADFINGFVDILENGGSFVDAITNALGGGSSKIGGAFSNIFETLKERLGPASEKFGEAMTKLFDFAVQKGGEFLSKIDWGKLFAKAFSAAKKNPKLAATIAAIFFGKTFLSTVGTWLTAKLGKAVMDWGMKKFKEKIFGKVGEEAGKKLVEQASKSALSSSSGGMFRSLGAKMGKGLAGGLRGTMSKLVPRIMSAAGPIAALAAAGIAGWQVGKALDKKFGISDKLAGVTGDGKASVQDQFMANNAAENIAARAKRSERSMRNAMAKAARISDELGQIAQGSMSEIQSALKSKKDLSSMERETLVRVLRGKMEAKKNTLLAAEFAKIEKDAKGIVWNDSEASIIEAKTKAQAKIHQTMRDAGELWTSVNEKSFMKMQQDSANQTQKFMRAQSIEKSMLSHMQKSAGGAINALSGVDVQVYEKLSKLKPEEIKANVKRIQEHIRPALIGKDGKGGLRKVIAEIGAAFADQEISRLGLVIYGISQFGSIGPAINALGKVKVDNDKIGEIFETVAKIADGLDPIKTDNVVKMADVAAGVSKFSEHYLVGHKNIQRLAKLNAARSAPPIAETVWNMVEQANQISDALASLSDVNMQAKMENLGRVLGFTGNDTLSIQNENFQVNINVQVVIDAEELANVLVDTGQVQSGPKSTRFK